jgi:hypothetical protein
MDIATDRPTPRPANNRWLYASLALASCAAAIAACGSSPRPARADDAGPLLRYAQCMRTHGLPEFPDPSASGGLVIPNDIDTQSPAFKTAQQACGHLAQGSGSASSPESAQLQLVALARCMRAHGVPGFADPTRSPPPPSRGNVLGGNGWYLALGTGQERQSPAYRRAAGACQLTAAGR